MRLGEPAKMQASINITPLVDVVLVLLIIFMVMAPQMRAGPEVSVPNTAKPGGQGDESRIIVSIDEKGGLWIESEPVAAEQFIDVLRVTAAGHSAAKIVIRGDSRLNFREVRQTMQAVEQAGFLGVGLIAQRDRKERGD